jgi:hypothetical protein
MLSGTGIVQVNGATSPRTSTVFAGDKVATAKDSTVTLTSRGRTILLPENSSVTYGGKRVKLEYGRALINAQRGTEAQLGNLIISPAQADAKLEMQTSGSNMVLMAKAGSLNVTNGSESLVLESGQTLMAAEPQDQGGAPRGTSPTPTYRNRICGFRSGDSGKRIPCGWWIVMGAAGATFVGLAATGEFSSGSSTPATALSPATP